jgi:uncharacterized protein (TIGR02246 family)
MKRIFCVAAIIAVLVVASSAQDKKSDGASKAEQEIAELNREWADAIVKGDMARLDRLFADDMTVVTGNGALRGKAGEMDDLKPTADIKTYFFNTEDVKIRVYGDSAVVTGHAKWRINNKGRDIDIERRYTSVFVKKDGRWQIVAQQLSRIAPQK